MNIYVDKNATDKLEELKKIEKIYPTKTKVNLFRWLAHIKECGKVICDIGKKNDVHAEFYFQ